MGDIFVKLIIFQSTLLREERRITMLLQDGGINYFNPRSYERSDAFDGLEVLKEQIISIHAPTRGATYVPSATLFLLKISIHAPTRGAT